MIMQLNVSLDPYFDDRKKNKDGFARSEQFSEIKNRKFYFNGNGPFSFATNNNDIDEFSYEKFLIAAGENKIKHNRLEWSYLSCGMHKEGFFRCTESIVEQIVRCNGFEPGQDVYFEFRYDINQNKNSSALIIKEHVIVKQNATKERCATFSTTYSVSERNKRPNSGYHYIRHNKTLVKIESSFGQKVFPDTRSILCKVQEYIVTLLRKILNKKPSANIGLFFAKRASSECHEKLMPDSRPLARTP